MVIKNHFGVTSSGKEVNEFILDNGSIKAHILDYGCIIRKILTKDKDGNFKDVVLGYDDVNGYEVNGGYIGAFIGRVANRIADAKFNLNHKNYKLFNNDGKNSLHGGEVGFDKKIFNSEIDGEKLILTTISPDGEENFPGNLSVKVTYYLKDCGLNMEYECVSDADTPLNLTNHSYFNLSNEDNVLNHFVKINSNYITPVDKNLIPTGELLQVSDTPFDFKNATKIGERIDYPHRQLKLAGGYDHNYVLKNYSQFEKVASVYAVDSGINMDVLTDNLGMQFYTGNFLNGEVGKNSIIYHERSGFCMETQNFPNAINTLSFPSRYLKKGDIYKRHTAYNFSVKN